MGKFREFLVLKIPGLTPGRVFSWPHILEDRDWLPNWKRKKQEQIHVIEYQAFTEAVELIDELEDAAKELRDLMDDVRNGDYKPDSFTNQPIDKALAKIKEFKDKGE